jgi:hypothetical protein
MRAVGVVGEIQDFAAVAVTITSFYTRGYISQKGLFYADFSENFGPPPSSGDVRK